MTAAAVFRMTGHGLAGPVVNARTLAAARLAHTLAKRAAAPVAADPDPAPFAYMAGTNAGRAMDPAAGWTARLVKAFRI